MIKRAETVSEERIYLAIKKSIILHKLLPNSQLVETKLAEEFGVSRTPVRNALRRLSYEGLVTLVPNKGAFVSQPSREEIEQLFQVRLELEGLAARLAATNVTDAQLERLDFLRQKEKDACRASDFEAYMAVNDSIHLLVMEASGNEVLLSVGKPLLDRSNVYLIFLDEFYGVPVERIRSIPEHSMIAEGLRARDPVRSETAIRAHLRSTFEHLNLNYFRIRELLSGPSK